MTIIDTRLSPQYSQLIPAMHALASARTGDELEVIMTDDEAFSNFKTYLAEHHIGFREIYHGDAMTLQFTL